MHKPDWLKAPIACTHDFSLVKSTLVNLNLNTVCESARCPNRSECWGAKTQTFMIMGDVCTRACRFCCVKTSSCGLPLEKDEPQRLAKAAKMLDMRYVVLTSVDRDDLVDGGASHFADCILALKRAGFLVEALIPDYADERLKMVASSGPDILAHNIEVVKQLQHLRDCRASYAKSIKTLRQAAKLGMRTKSSIMLGLGEGIDQVIEAMDDLLDAGCESLVLGQYLQPDSSCAQVKEYIVPEIFDELAKKARQKGFTSVVSRPLARTSYMAHQVFRNKA